MIPTVRHDRALCAGSTSPGSFPVAYSFNLGRYAAYYGDKELCSDLTVQFCVARGMEHKAALKSPTSTRNLSGPSVVEKNTTIHWNGPGLEAERYLSLAKEGFRIDTPQADKCSHGVLPMLNTDRRRRNI